MSGPTEIVYEKRFVPVTVQQTGLGTRRVHQEATMRERWWHLAGDSSRHRTTRPECVPTLTHRQATTSAGGAGAVADGTLG